MRFAAVLAALIAALAAGDFFDDFESYSVGDDPGDSPDWSREPAGGYVLVADDGGDQVIEAHFPDSAFVGYLCDGAGFWDDGSVSIEFSVTGSGVMVNVFSRMQLMTGETYVGGLIVWLQPFTFVYIAHVSVTGEYEILFQDGGPSMPPGTWADIRLEAAGSDPVTLTLYCKDQMAGQVEDSVHVLGSGLSGFACIYDDQVPTILADDFRVTETPQALLQGTFGAVKASFSP